ncbi:MAG TPA: sensor domain-containing diguanylate cyclase [Methylophilaceae bacterium]|nr:sensor domain-containing diguanylate cyclase [Methylophilaceae bacterium]
MKTPEKPVNEQARLDTLRSLNILETGHEERFDRLTRLARRLFHVPIALVSILDAEREWFKSSPGFDLTETSREISFSGHAILSDDLLIVPDTARDERFHDNPLVTGTSNIRFYAGCPITTRNGTKLGTFAIMDHKPRRFTQNDRDLLRDLANMVEQEIEASRHETTDELTLLSNRHGFETLAERALKVCKRSDAPATLLLFNLKDFRQVNDQFGYAEGDRALVAFSTMLVEIFRESDVIGRIGGDEFVVLLTNTAKTESSGVLERLTEALQGYNRLSRRGYNLGYSVEAVEYDPEMHHSIGELLQEADTHMYQSKKLEMRAN